MPQPVPVNEFGFIPDSPSGNEFGFVPDPVPMTRETSALEMDRIMRAPSTPIANAPALPLPAIARRPNPRPFYELPVPIPGTEKTGLPPPVPARQPQVEYNEWGEVPGAADRLRSSAGQPLEEPIGRDIYGNPSDALGEAALPGGRAVMTGLGSTVAGTGKGLALFGRSAGPITRLATAPVMASGAGMEGIGKALQLAGETITPPAKEGDAKYSRSWWKDPSLLADPDYMAWQAGNAGGSMLAYMLPMVGALGRVGSTVRGLTAAMSFGESLANSAEVYDKAKAAGASDAQALDAFKANLPKDFVFTYLTNKAGIFSERIPNAKLRTAVSTALEPVQEVGQGAIGQQTLGKPLTEDWDVNALGGILGGPVGGMMSPLNHQATAPAHVEEAPNPAAAPPISPPIEAQPAEPAAPRDIYAEARAVAKESKQLGTTALSKKLGISQDDARVMLDRLAEEGVLEPKPLKGGGTTWINAENRKASPGPVVLKTAQAQAELENEIGFVPDAEVTPNAPPMQTSAPMESRAPEVQALPDEVDRGVPNEPPVPPVPAVPSVDRNQQSAQVESQPASKEVVQFQPDNPQREVTPNEPLQQQEAGASPGSQTEAAPAPQKHEYSSTQANLPESLAARVREAAAKIPDSDLAEDGRESEPHITVKYGLHGENAEAVAKVLANEPPIKARLGEVTKFDNSEKGFDVVKFDVESPDLHRLNKKIADALPHTDTHPDYHPHVTLAYVKPGEAEKYLGPHPLTGQGVTLNEVTFSGKDGEKVRIPLGGEASRPSFTERHLQQLDEAGQAATERLRERGISSGETAGANLFTDPTVIRDMALSILGDVARGTVHAKNVAARVVASFGRAAQRVAPRVFARAQSMLGKLRRKPVGKPLAVPQSVDPEVEARLTGAETEPEPKNESKIPAAWHKFTRQYQHLPAGERFGPLKFRLNQLRKANGIASHDAMQAIVEQIGGMSKDEYRVYARTVALNDLVASLKEEAKRGRVATAEDLPFAYKSKADIIADRKALRDAAAKSPTVTKALQLRADVWNRVKPPYIKAMKLAGKDVSEAVSRKDYLHHRVIQHLMDKERLGEKAKGSGQGAQLHTPTGRGWLKERFVNAADYSLAYARAEYEVLQQMMWDTKRAQFLAWVADPKNGLNILPELKKKAKEYNKAIAMPHFERLGKKYGVSGDMMYKAIMNRGKRNVGPQYEQQMLKRMAGEKYLDPANTEALRKKFADDTHIEYQPREGNIFYFGTTVEEKMLQEMMESIARNEVPNFDPSALRKVMILGGKRPQIVIPREAAQTMLEFMEPPSDDWYASASRKALQGWKKLKLVSPVGVAKYNIRNMSGDMERVITVLPRALRHTLRAIREIRQFRKAGADPSPEFGLWFRRGGMESNLQVAEMGDVDTLRQVEHLIDKKLGAAGTTAKAIGDAWNAIWDKSRAFTDVREGILRYATFLEFLNQVKGGAAPKTFGASLREEVMALKDPADRAFKLSNDLMLAYDETTHFGQWARGHLIPFYSFMERNPNGYYRIMRNAIQDGQLAGQVGRAILPATARVGAYTTVKIGSTALRLLALKSLLSLYNWYRDDLDRDLPEAQRKQTHLVLYRGKDGKVRSFSRLGLVDDLLEWVGLDAAPWAARQYLNGKMTLREMAEAQVGWLWKVPVPAQATNKLAQSVTPFFKTPAELISGKAWFPDFFKKRSIRDTGEYIARELGLTYAYRKLASKPQKPFSWDTLADFFVYTYDPGETHYNGMRYDLVPAWQKAHGKEAPGGFEMNRRAEALRDVRESLRYQDQPALAKALAEYGSAGGNQKNMLDSIERLHPLGALPKSERPAFIKSLTPAERDDLAKAVEFWQEHYNRRRSELTHAAEASGLRKRK